MPEILTDSHPDILPDYPAVEPPLPEPEADTLSEARLRREEFSLELVHKGLISEDFYASGALDRFGIDEEKGRDVLVEMLIGEKIHKLHHLPSVSALEAPGRVIASKVDDPKWSDDERKRNIQSQAVQPDGTFTPLLVRVSPGRGDQELVGRKGGSIMFPNEWPTQKVLESVMEVSHSPGIYHKVTNSYIHQKLVDGVGIRTYTDKDTGKITAAMPLPYGELRNTPAEKTAKAEAAKQPINLELQHETFCRDLVQKGLVSEEFYASGALDAFGLDEKEGRDALVDLLTKDSKGRLRHLPSVFALEVPGRVVASRIDAPNLSDEQRKRVIQSQAVQPDGTFTPQIVGARKSGSTMFPNEWSTQKVLESVIAATNSPGLYDKETDRYMHQKVIDGVGIRTYTDRNTGKITTATPLMYGELQETSEKAPTIPKTAEDVTQERKQDVDKQHREFCQGLLDRGLVSQEFYDSGALDKFALNYTYKTDALEHILRGDTSGGLHHLPSAFELGMDQRSVASKVADPSLPDNEREKFHANQSVLPNGVYIAGDVVIPKSRSSTKRKYLGSVMFPNDWSTQDVIAAAVKAAEAPGIFDEVRNGYTHELVVNGVNVKVATRPEDNKIITAYPTQEQPQ